MARTVTVNKDHTTIGEGIYKTGDVVRILDSQFTALTSAGAFAGGTPTLTDGGAAANAGDNVYTQGATVSPPAALTSAASVGVPTKVEFDKVVADLTALRTTQAALITALSGAGKPLTP